MISTIRPNRGFTLIELVTVIVILGVASAGIASFVRGSMQTYIDVSIREQLLSESRFAIERLKRELRNAVPNSVRITGNSNYHCMQFVPINWATVYIDLPKRNDPSFEIDVVALHDINNVPYILPSGNNYAVVYPTRSEDVYDPDNGHRVTVSGCSDDGDGDCNTLDDSDNIVQLEVTGLLAQESPASRVYLIDRAVSYCVYQNRLIRYKNDLLVNQLGPFPGLPVIAEHVANVLSADPVNNPQEDDPFRIISTSLQSNSIAEIRLRFIDNNEQIAYQQEIHIDNIP
jgi:MSHA biogenesis protein MshO